MDGSPRPCEPHGDQVVLDALPPSIKGRSQRSELLLQVARSHPEDDPTAGENVQGGNALGGHKGVSVSGDKDVRVQQEAFGGRCHNAENGERVERMMAAARGKLGRREPMIGDVASRDTGVFQGLGDGGDHAGRQEVRVPVDLISWQRNGEVDQCVLRWCRRLRGIAGQPIAPVAYRSLIRSSSKPRSVRTSYV